ncbi:hypothetical protein DERP_001011 [Dermatophagoides pteronyssinus]|uniref:Uncharacterized protein n=1 Tax=Dermatophagoides pteronyssinus TaxID=6956 RepID=A0ABQ8JD99_DERPT|nr:hypothetical protein DERP_001011 [Dermatophagoides pteronyssinus]
MKDYGHVNENLSHTKDDVDDDDSHYYYQKIWLNALNDPMHLNEVEDHNLMFHNELYVHLMDLMHQLLVKGEQQQQQKSHS